MSTAIVLLRGVMPSGRNKVPMARLREVLTDAGFGNVRTYIQSGNALVESDLPAGEIEAMVRRLIREQIGPDLVVVVRTSDQLQSILDANPFREGYEIARVFFVIFAQSPALERVVALRHEDFGQAQLAITEQAAYMYIPVTYGSLRLDNNFLERKLGVSATMRNFNTLSRLIALGRDAAE